MGAPQNGTLIGIYVGNTKIANVVSNSFKADNALRDTTTKDSGGWSASGDGLKSWSADGKGLFADAPTYGFSDLWAIFIAGSGVTVKITSAVTGEKKYSGTAYITNLSQNADLEKTAEFSVSFKGSGVLTEATN